MTANTLEKNGQAVASTCFHCRQPCDEIHWFEEKPFCCDGCKTVFEILNSNNLCEYYNLDKNPGNSQRNVSGRSYTYLDNNDIRKKLLTFTFEDFAKVTFFIPNIHCVSCIWLLENIQKLQRGVLRSEVNFARKTISVDFNPKILKLSDLANLLGSVGYAPQINLDSQESKKPVADRSLILKLVVAGFCFGNIMLFSFPEYLGLDSSDRQLMRIFSWLNLFLSIPVFFYSGADYFFSAAKSFKQRQINIDVPIALGLIALFSRSCYDILSATAPGYLDSFTGLVFFLLIGRWFQSKTYESLAFDRDFKSYFPLAVSKLVGDEWKPVVIYDLRRGDQIRIRNMEIIPADCTLLDLFAWIDYSFVTGESKPVKVNQADIVYAGGRLVGQSVFLVVEKKTSQSHLTGLWNNAAFKKVTASNYQKLIDRAARRFTWIVLAIALITAIYWQGQDASRMWLVLTSVLMVACPCALALAAPFTYGSMLRVFGKYNLYLKNSDVIERMATIDAVVFDKTGTVTHDQTPEIFFSSELTNYELGVIKVLTASSTHPLSVMIAKSISARSIVSVTDFKEFPGKGIQALANGSLIQIGSAAFVGCAEKVDSGASHVFVRMCDEVKGYFSIRTSVRKNIKSMLDRLGEKCVALLSGDNEAERVQMAAHFRPAVQLLFNQSPHDKLEFIRQQQERGRNVLMIGDGLNDAGALKQSDVGIAVTDDTGIFTPACDGILKGNKIDSLDTFLDLAKSSTTILKCAFAISFLYNAIALTVAVTGNLTPLVAAILMPLSSISVVGFSSLAVNFVAHKKLQK